jgi:hypothetical protein
MPPGILAKAQATTAKPAIASNASVDAWSAIVWLGFAFALIGWSDVFIGLYPYQVGNPDWEFGAVSAMLDSMPLGTLGVGMATAACTAQHRRLGLLVLAILATMAAMLLVLCGGMYGLAVPVVLKSIPDPTRLQMSLVMLKSVIMLVTYLTLYVVLSRFAWTAVRANRGS